MKKITEDDKKFLIENYPTKGSKFCREHLNLSKSTVCSAARRLGLKVNQEVSIKNKTKNIIDINDYIEVKDPKIAYILGLVWTDGHISLSNNKTQTPVVKHCCVAYDSEKSDIIFKQLNWRGFKSENKKSIGKNKMSINWISSRELGNYLIENNFKNKNNGTFIHKKFENYISHFLRGIFDGDGCITISKSNQKYLQTSIYFSSSYEQNWTYLEDILHKIKVNYKIRKLKDKLGKSSQLYINESMSIYNLCEFMYKDSKDMRLDRKYNKFLKFIEYKRIYEKNNDLKSIIDGSISQIEQQ